MQILIPGAFNHYKDIMRFITKYPQLIKHSEVYDGVQNSKWNGGRIDCLAPTELDFNKVKAINDVAKFIENDSNFFKDEEMVQLYKIQMLGMNSFYKD